MGLTDDQLKAMEASAPLLVHEYRQLRVEHAYMAVEWVPMHLAEQGAAAASQATMRAVIDVIRAVANDFDDYHKAKLLAVVDGLTTERGV